VIDPYRADENLKYGPDYRPLRPATLFAFNSREGNGLPAPSSAASAWANAGRMPAA